MHDAKRSDPDFVVPSPSIRSWSWLGLLFALFLAACSPPLEEGECGPHNCSGCCEGSECVEGNTRLACGAEGLACGVCDTDQRCSRGACVAAKDRCNAGNCDGCCAGSECLRGDVDSACGKGANACRACSGGLVCREGACLEPIKPPCDSITCSQGCCLDGECVEGNSEDTCGFGGMACGSCDEGESCNAGRCYAEVDLDCAATCKGCCLNGQCMQGSEDEACGLKGASCRSCEWGTLCEVESGVCVVDTRPCGPENCKGCCHEGVCVDGDEVDSCGVAGEVCSVCEPGQRCLEQACTFKLPSCGPWNCSGCCQDGVCLDSEQNAQACGVDGLACKGCDSKLGELCEEGQCVPALEPCSGDNCNGCCQDGRCLEGVFASACGSQGVACERCSSAEACVAQECVPSDIEALCGPFSCAGCCVDGSCNEGESEERCGASGTMCATCDRGQTCLAGNCVPAVSGCSADNCEGCCDDGVCRPGTRSAQCGKEGAACGACLMGQQCIAQVCTGEVEACDEYNCEGCCRDGLCLSGAALNACGVGGNECRSCAEGRACKSGNCVAVGFEAQADWTVLVYMAADSHLDDFAIADLREMADPGKSERINLIALVDRSADHARESLPGAGLWSGAKLLKLGGGAAEELADWGEVDMGDPATLRRFIAEGSALHPAGYHALVLWNHGAGWAGFGKDESANSQMSLGSLRNAIATGLADARLSRFDLLGFDASFMGSVEVVHQMRGLAKYLVASPERVAGHGWDYSALANLVITATGVRQPEDLAKELVDAYSLHAEEHGTEAHSAMSAFDMAHASDLVRGVNNMGWGLFRSLSAGSDWRQFARQLAGTSRFGFDPQQDGVLFDLSEVIGATYGVEASGIGEAVGDAYYGLAMAVLKSYSGKHAGMGGVSVYLPESEQAFEARYGNTDFGRLGGWLSFVQRYLGHASNELEHAEMQGVSPESVELVAEPWGAWLTLTFKPGAMPLLREFSAFYARYLPDTGAFSILGTRPVIHEEGQSLESDWDYRLAALSDGYRQVPVPLFSPPGPLGGLSGTVMSRFEYKAPHLDEWLPVSLQFELDGPWGGSVPAKGKVIRAWTVGRYGVAEVKLEEHGQLRPVLPQLGSESLLWVVSSDEEQVLSVGEEPLVLQASRAPGGEYAMGMLIRDWAGGWTLPYGELEVVDLGIGAVGTPCPNGHSDCESGHCLEDWWTGVQMCTQACAAHSDCPTQSNTWCDDQALGEPGQSFCRARLPIDTPCFENLQCQSGACWDHEDWLSCVPSCTSSVECEEGSECLPLKDGVKGCIWP